MASYFLSSFGSVALPRGNAAASLGVGPVPTPTLRTVTGTLFDPNYSARRFPSGTMLSLTGQYYDTTLAGLDTQYAALRQMVGTRQQLWRTRIHDGALQWTWARLVSEPSGMTLNDVLEQTVRCEFLQLSPYWYNATITNFNTTLSGASPKALALPNATAADGAVQTNTIVTVTAGTSSLTAFRLYDNDVVNLIDWQFAGTLATTKSLIVNTGSYSVTNDGTAAFGSFTLNAGHLIYEWMYLTPGTHDMLMTWTGGGTGGTVTISYYQAYV